MNPAIALIETNKPASNAELKQMDFMAGSLLMTEHPSKLSPGRNQAKSLQGDSPVCTSKHPHGFG
jgi:hypothetical protein